MNKIGIGILTLFLSIACSKNENTSASSDNETNWTLSHLEMKSGNGNWVPVSISEINETLIINSSAQAMTRTLSDSDCKLTFVYNIDWGTDSMVFEGYSTDSYPRNCDVTVLHCPDSYETMAFSTFTFTGEISDDENTLTATCSTGSSNGNSYRYTYVK